MGIEILLLILFAITLFFIYFYKKLNEKTDFCLGVDINKPEKKPISEGTGIVLLVPFWIVVLFLVYFQGFGSELLIYATIVSVFGIVGFFDDLQHKFLAKSATWKLRTFPIVIASLIFAFLFAPDLIWIIPLSLYVAGVASMQNTFAGLNGWEVGSGFIIILFISYILIGSPFFFVAISLAAIIFALLIFNIFPAKVFPGDSGTLFIGSSISALMLLTRDLNLIILSFLLFFPHMIDFFILKLITNREDLTQQKTRPYNALQNGLLSIPNYPDNKIRYDFAKLLIKIFGPLKERTIVLFIWSIVIVNGFFWLTVFGKI